MTNVSQTERRATIEQFLTSVADDPAIKPGWKEWMLDLSTPDLPDDPTVEQIEAWIELQRMIADPAFIQLMRDNARDSTPFDGKEMTKTYDALTLRAREVMDTGADPSSPAGRALAHAYFEGLAQAMRVPADAQFIARMRRKHLEHKPQIARYWELVTALGGLRGAKDRRENWQQPPESRWLGNAIDHRLTEG